MECLTCLGVAAVVRVGVYRRLSGVVNTDSITQLGSVLGGVRGVLSLLWCLIGGCLIIIRGAGCLVIIRVSNSRVSCLVTPIIGVGKYEARIVFR